MAQIFSDSQGTLLAVGDRVSTPDGAGIVLALVAGNVPGVDSDEAAVVELGQLQRAYPPSALAQAP
jgi:hypothetical protein